MADKIKISAIVDLLSAECNVSKSDAAQFVSAFQTLFEEILLRDKILKINDIGTFRVEETKPRRSVDINTGQTIEIPSHSRITFTPAASLATAVNSDLAHLTTFDLDMDTNTDTPMTEPTPNDAPLQRLTSDAIGIRSLLDEIQNVPEAAPSDTEPEPQPEAQPEPSPKEETKPRHDTPVDTDTAVVDGTAAVAAINREDNRGMRTSNAFWLSVAAVLTLLIIGIVVWNNRDFFSPTPSSAPITVTDTITASAAVTDTMPVKSEEPDEAESLDEIPQTYIDTATLREGSRLTLLALKYYGHKDFWVYIYQANRDIITNPNDIKTGTRLRIPKMPEHLVDPNSTEALQYARQLKDEL